MSSSNFYFIRRCYSTWGVCIFGWGAHYTGSLLPLVNSQGIQRPWNPLLQGNKEILSIFRHSYNYTLYMSYMVTTRYISQSTISYFYLNSECLIGKLAKPNPAYGQHSALSYVCDSGIPSIP